MNPIAIDTEGPRFDDKEKWRGNAYGDPNDLVCWSWADNYSSEAKKWESTSMTEIEVLCRKRVVIVANGKHDISWMRRYGLNTQGMTFWDILLAQFIITHQTVKFPSLDYCCEYFGLPKKLDLIKEEFWQNKCSCYVSVVERLSHILLSNSVLNAIMQSTSGKIESAEMLKSELGEQLIQISMKLLKSGNVQNLLLILLQRLTLTKSQSVISMDSHMLNMMISWQEKAAACVEKLRNLSASTTAIEQEKLETCCVDIVMQLLDILKNQNGWNKHHDTCKPTPIDTKDVPWPILSEYAAYDTHLTRLVYYKQLEVMSPAQIKLCKLMSQDMLVLQEMEQNGITYDPQLCEQRSKQLDEETTLLQQKLSAFYPNIPINFASGDDLSAFLYGGTIIQTIKVHDGFYKTGLKKGQPKLKNQDVEHHLPALFSPIKGSELKKEGYFETNESCLRKLTGKNKPVVDLLLDLARIEKLNGTYYKGLPKLNDEMHWPTGKLHGQLNQTLAVSGRLSSSKPNQQNFATEIQDIFVSEYL